MSRGRRRRSDEISRQGVLSFGDLNLRLPSTLYFRVMNLNDDSNNICKFFNARTWREESINCCGKGKYVVHRLKPLPADVLSTFSTRHFLQRQSAYNSTFCFTCLGASPGPTWTQPSYPSMLKLHGHPYHRVMDSFRGSYENTVQNNARMNIYDHELQKRTKVLHLDGETVKIIADNLRRHNSWVKEYRALLVEIDDSDCDNMSIFF